jgi:2-methylisocitrate lyase-like PEP mutase family enzyme
MTSGRRDAFAGLHRRAEPLFLPNAWDYASAAVLVQAGYVAVGTTSLGVAAAAGKPDARGETREETVDLARRLASLPVLLTVDIESGFSDDPAQVAEVGKRLRDAGVAGINLEDGRHDGTLSPADLNCAKIAAVRSLAPELFINARTDAFWLAGPSSGEPACASSAALLSETLQRASAYLAAGADGIFVPGAADLEMVRTLSSAIDAPLNILYQPGQHTFRELAKAGAARVSTGSLLFREALNSVLRTARRARGGAVPADSDRPTYARVQACIPSR